MNNGAQDNLHWLLMKVALKAKQRFIKIAEENGLTLMQAYSVLLLEPESQVPMHSISGLLGCDPSNVTGIVDNLEESGYIERHENPNDRRIKGISLTASGAEFRRTLMHRLEKDNVPDLTLLSGDEAKKLQKYLLKILKD